MVNASLNWASIVGIVLAICGAGLYFMRSFKPALARDYDVFFAAIGLLCGGILFFQGWRLDPILQFGQFLLAGTTVFFAYESVRLRGVATDQARRSSYFDEPDSGIPPNASFRGGSRWEDSYDRFEESEPIRRRFPNRDEQEEESSDRDLYQPRRISRAAIPEEAASRRGRERLDRNSLDEDLDRSRRSSRFRKNDFSKDQKSSFGQRRNSRQDLRRGSRPSANEQTSSRRGKFDKERNSSRATMDSPASRDRRAKGSFPPPKIEDAAFSSRNSRTTRKDQNPPRKSDQQFNSRFPSEGRYKRSSPGRSPLDRDNNSRFDD